MTETIIYVKTLHIERGRWGEGRLLTRSGKCCAAGFFSLALGIPQELIIDSTTPEFLDEWVEVLNIYPGATPQWLADVMKINDRLTSAHDERERLLIDVFKRIGVELVFTGEYQ